MARRRGSRKKVIDDVEHALASAYRLLIFRDRSENELRSRLMEKGYSPEVVEQAIHILKSESLIDDLEFARSFVRSRNAKGLAPNMIVRQLVVKFGIDRPIAEEAVNSEYDPEIAVREVKKMMTKKLLSLLRFKGLMALHGQSLDRVRRNLAGFAIRRGFPQHQAFRMADEVIKSVLRQTVE